MAFEIVGPMGVGQGNEIIEKASWQAVFGYPTGPHRRTALVGWIAQGSPLYDLGLDAARSKVLETWSESVQEYLGPYHASIGGGQIDQPCRQYDAWTLGN